MVVDARTRLGRPTYTHAILDAAAVDPIVGPWIEIDTRENSTMVSCWTEKLCVRKRHPQYELAICINGALSEDFVALDDDDEIDDPALADALSDRLPAFSDGVPVTLREDGLLCGKLIPSDEFVATLVDTSVGELRAAIEAIGWAYNPRLAERMLAAIPESPKASSLSPELVEAYVHSAFQVAAEPVPFELRVGEASAELMEQYRSTQKTTATYITAHNPFGEQLTPGQNAIRHALLRMDIEELGLPYLEGQGCGDHGDWPPEMSFLVLGLTYEQAIHLGRHHEQNAIVWAFDDAVPRLLLLQ